MNKSQKIKIIVMLTLIFLVTLGGITYAYFSITANGNNTASSITVSMANLSIAYTDGNIISMRNIYPGWSKTKTFTVRNTGSDAVEYDIALINVTNEFTNDELVYTLTSSGGANITSETVVPHTNGNLATEVSIDSLETQTYTLMIKFKETNSNQNHNQGVSFTGKIQILTPYTYTTPIPTLQELILEETAYADNVNSTYVQNGTPGINYAAISSATNGQGLYYTSTNTESTCEVGDETYVSPGVCRSYFYRGAVENNYVSFAGELWRIIRINEDGSIRMILNDKLTNINVFQLQSVDVSKRNMYMPDNEVVSGSAADVLNTWYNTTLSTTEKAKVSTDAIYCNDMSIGNTDGDRTYFGTRTRLSSSTPQFLCPQRNDKLVSTSSTLNASNVNKVLVQPIGLITADEAMYAGKSWTTKNTSFYLYRSYSYWSLSPHYVSVATDNARGFIVNSSNGFSNSDYSVWYARGLVPVITLRSDALATGSGVVGDEYIIQ